MKNQIKSLIAGIAIGAALMTTVTAIAANFQAVTATFPILIDGKEFTSENPPVVIDGRTYLPLRAIGEALGVGVDWNAELSRVEINKGSRAVEAGPSDASAATTDSSKLTFGSTFEFDGYEITFSQPVSWAKLDNKYSDLHGRDFFKIPVKIKNNNDKSGSINMFYYRYFNPKGLEVDKVYGLFDDNIFSAGDIRPGATQDTFMYIQYDGDGNYYVEFKNFETSVEVELPIKK